MINLFIMDLQDICLDAITIICKDKTHLLQLPHTIKEQLWFKSLWTCVCKSNNLLVDYNYKPSRCVKCIGEKENPTNLIKQFISLYQTNTSFLCTKCNVRLGYYIDINNNKIQYICEICSKSGMVLVVPQLVISRLSKKFKYIFICQIFDIEVDSKKLITCKGIHENASIFKFFLFMYKEPISNNFTHIEFKDKIFDINITFFELVHTSFTTNKTWKALPFVIILKYTKQL